MVPSARWFGSVAVLAILVDGAMVFAQGPGADATMSADVQSMHERLIALSKGEGSLSKFRIEFMDGGMAAHRSVNIEAGKLESKEWTAPGAAMVHRVGTVADARVSHLLEQLIAKRYWTFQGTRFTPDARMFLFRFYYEDLEYVDFRCDADEFRASPARVDIRNLFLRFAAETEMTTVPAK